jgi:ABC-2 type transport system ATP-binding protein
MPLIETTGLAKEFRVFKRREGVRGAVADLFHRRYETLRAVDGIDLRIDAGERVGYIGPNGAGKSTTLKMLTGILVPSAGSVRIAGLDPHRHRERCLQRIGVVFGQRSQLWWDLAPIESFRLLASVYGLDAAGLRRRLEAFERSLEIGPCMHTPVRKLSLGQKMRCELAAALLHSPDIVFLDEPTIGLDLVAKEGIRRFLLEENRLRGTTFILTTHDLSDIEELCERVVIIDRGRILYDGGLADLKRRFGDAASLVFRILHPRPRPGAAEPTALEALASCTRDLPVRWTDEGDGAFRASFAIDAAFRASFAIDAAPRAEVIRRVLDGFEVADVAFAEAKIEDVIRRIYQEARRDGAP